jgi:geranylgeranyl pyrophosphate synthase
MVPLNDLILELRTDVDAALGLLIPRPDVEPRVLHEAIRWSVFAGGKRIRPAIVRAAGETFGAPAEALVNTMAAFEMVHTYSLIHDDLPSMDDDDLRRGRATCHKRFGEATAILAGDVLQTLAFKAIADDSTLMPELRVRLLSLLADAAGTPSGMVAGQQLDLNAEGKNASIEEIERIHGKKTGALITASALAGAMIGGAAKDDLRAIRAYAQKLGLLFQITDDILDVTQGTEQLGKTAGKDAASEKSTYAAHFGIEKTRSMASRISEDACLALSSIGRDTTLLSGLADLILSRNA